MYTGYCTVEQLLTGSESTDFCSRHVDVQAFAELLPSLPVMLTVEDMTYIVCKDIVGQLAEMCDGCMPLMTGQVMLLATASNVAQIKQMNALYLTIQLLALTD